MQEQEKAIASLTIIRYPRQYIFFALLAMAVHRVPLYFNHKIVFWKLLGSGKGGGFSKTPDWQQWAIFTVRADSTLAYTQSVSLKSLYGRFIAAWYQCFKCEINTLLLAPVSGHGHWDSKPVFGKLSATTDYTGQVAVLTRATIRMGKLKRFWAHVDETAALLQQADGLEYSVSIGEIPFIKQATFSIWNSVEAMKAFAYATQHADIIRKTRSENWYSEELFVRFKVLKEFKGRHC